MSVALRGNLKDFGIAEVFQLIGQQRKTGVLELSTRNERVQLVFDRGAVVSAAPAGSRPHEALGEMLVRCGLLTVERVAELHRDCGPAALTLPRLAVARGELPESEVESIEDLLTRETIFTILRWEEGSFDFTAQDVDHGRSFDTLLGAEQILMDGLRMVDEWQSFADLVPSEEQIFQRSGPFEDYASQAPRGPRTGHAERIYRLVDGRITVRRIIDLSLLGTFDATRMLSELRRAGVIEPVAPEVSQRVRELRRQIAVPRFSVRGALAALVPLLLLAAAAFTAHRPVPPRTLPGVAVERAALDGVREAHETRRLRHALDAFRLIEGRWPRDLAELRDRGLPVPDALAGRPGRPYYYAHREGDALLLAPER